MDIVIERRTNRAYETVARIQNLPDTELPGVIGQVINMAFDEFNADPSAKQVDFHFKGQFFRANRLQ